MPSASHPTLLLIHGLVVIYALAYQLQTPLEPYLVDKLKNAGTDSSAAYAQLQSFFAGVQMLGSLLVGSMIDALGVRAMLLVNFASCALTYALLAAAADSSSLALLYASKLPTVFMAGFLCAQSAVCSLTEPGAERVKQLGRLTTAYTLGATLGPALGGWLGSALAARLAVAASLAAGALVLALPSTLNAGRQAGGPGSAAARRSAADARAAPRASWLATAASVLALAWPLVATKAAAGLVNAANGAVRTLALKDVFLLSAAQLGVVMSAIFSGTAVASLALGWLTQALGSEAALVRACLGGAAAALAAQAALFVFAAPPPGAPPALLQQGLYVGLTLALALCTFPLSTTLTALSTARAPPEARGTLVGIEHSVFALASVLGPAVGVAARGAVGLGGVVASASAAYAVLLVLWGGVSARSESSGGGGGGGGSSSSGAGTVLKALSVTKAAKGRSSSRSRSRSRSRSSSGSSGRP